MGKSVYLENVQSSIKRQMKWAGIDNQIERDVFLAYIIKYCEYLMNRPFKQPKSAKTRHGSGRK